MRSTSNVQGFPLAKTAFLLLAVAAMSAGNNGGSQYTFKTIAKTGQSEEQVTFDQYFQPGGINNQGQISFAPSIQTGGESVFLAGGRNLIKVRAAGDWLPGGAKFGYTLGPVGMTAQGDTTFISTGLDVPLPLGLNAGVYRTVLGIGLPVSVMLPGVTATPGGGVFYGAAFNSQMNDLYETVFPGMVCSTVPTKAPSPGNPPCKTGQLEFGIYHANLLGQISAVVEPGSVAPGGSYFDYAQVPFINNFGDVAFDAHVYNEPCTDSHGQQGFRIFCGESVYLKKAHSGGTISIAHQGQRSPIDGNFYYVAFGPVLNDLGDLVFVAELSHTSDLTQNSTGNTAVFLYSHGTTTTVAKPGDPMPGGGKLVTAGGSPNTAYLNNNLEVAFVGTLDNGDQGLYRWKNGTVTLVAKTGTAIDGGAAIANLDDFDYGTGASSQVAINDLGQIIFAANLKGGGGAMLLATPR